MPLCTSTGDGRRSGIGWLIDYDHNQLVSLLLKCSWSSDLIDHLKSMPESRIFNVGFDLVSGNLVPNHVNATLVGLVDGGVLVNFAYVDPQSSPLIEGENDNEGNQILLARPFVRISLSYRSARNLLDQLKQNLDSIGELKNSNIPDESNLDIEEALDIEEVLEDV